MQAIERVIIRALLRDMREEGYQPAAVWDGGAYVMAHATFDENSQRLHSSQSPDTDAPDNIVRPMTDEEVLEAVDSVDECTLHFTRKNATTWGDRGVYLVLGNGEDVISDSHGAKGESFGAVIDHLYTQLEAGDIA
jgi:hypothetical protein